MLIRPGKPIDLLFLEELELVAPDFLFEEIENNKELILNKLGLSKSKIDSFITILKEEIEIIAKEHQFGLMRRN